MVPLVIASNAFEFSLLACRVHSPVKFDVLFDTLPHYHVSAQVSWNCSTPFSHPLTAKLHRLLCKGGSTVYLVCAQ